MTRRATTCSYEKIYIQKVVFAKIKSALKEQKINSSVATAELTVNTFITAYICSPIATDINLIKLETESSLRFSSLSLLDRFPGREKSKYHAVKKAV